MHVECNCLVSVIKFVIAGFSREQLKIQHLKFIIDNTLGVRHLQTMRPVRCNSK